MSVLNNLTELPPGWIYAQLGDLIEPSKEKIDPLTADSSHYIGLEHIEKDTGKIISSGKSEDTTSIKSVFHEGDLLYGKLRPYLNKVCVPDFDGVCSTDILVFHKNANLSNKYLKYRMLCPDFVRFANQNATGVNHPRVDFKKISTFIMPLPPLAEQHRIVAKIEELFTRLDAGVESLKKARVQLKLNKQAVLKSAFEGRLSNNFRNKNELEPAIQFLRRLGIVQSSANDTQSNYIPFNWELSNIGKLKEFSLYGPRFSSDDYSDNGIVILRTSDISESGKVNLNKAPKINLTDEEFKKYKVEKGDLLITRTGSIGTLAV